MEKKGIKTEQGEFNRWIRRTNAFIRDLRKSLAALLESIKEIKAELDKPQYEPVIILLQRYFDMRNAKAYSQTAMVNNLKELNQMANYLKANEIYTIEDLESRVSTLKDTVDELKQWLKSLTAPEDDSPCVCFSDPYLKHAPWSPDKVVRDISFDGDGNIRIKNISAYWIPELTLTEEISGTIYTVTGSYEGEDSFFRKLERITSRKFTNQLGGHQ